MHRALFLLVGLILALSACTQRMICPAYQSAFIHDQRAMSRRVSYFNEDSTPKILTVSKNKYLIIPEESYRKKIRQMKTVPMKSVHPVLPDSLLKKKDDEPTLGAEMDSVAVARIDSAATAGKKKDSTYMISIDREVYSVRYVMDSDRYVVDTLMYTSDQDNYMWYFRDVLVLPDVRAALMEKQDKKDAAANGVAGADSVQKKGIGGFFKNLFKKKSKKNDSTAVVTAAAASSSATTADTSATATPQKKVKSKGLFGKKKKDEVVEPAKPKDPAKKEDDGF